MAKLFAITFQGQARNITLTEEGTGNVIARIMAPSKAQTAPDMENFERLAACWNAFEGKSLDEIKAFAQRDGGDLATADEIALAQGTHGRPGMIEVDSPAAASRTDGGVWVAAWVFVPDEDAQPDDFAKDDVDPIARKARLL